METLLVSRRGEGEVVVRHMNREIRGGVIKAGGEVSVDQLKVLMGIL